jgi:hypothetical protein
MLTAASPAPVRGQSGPCGGEEGRGPLRRKNSRRRAHFSGCSPAPTNILLLATLPMPVSLSPFSTLLRDPLSIKYLIKTIRTTGHLFFVLFELSMSEIAAFNRKNWEMSFGIIIFVWIHSYDELFIQLGKCVVHKCYLIFSYQIPAVAGNLIPLEPFDQE